MRVLGIDPGVATIGFGVVDIQRGMHRLVQYGVITSIYSAFNQGDSYTDGTTKAIANVLMADGSTQTITIDLAKKIDKVVVSITYPVAGQTPVESGSFPADANVHATATSPTAKKTDATVASVVWPDGLDGAGKFDRSLEAMIDLAKAAHTAVTAWHMPPKAQEM